MDSKERRAARGESQSESLVWRLRSGQLDLDTLELAAHLGHAPASEILETTPTWPPSPNPDHLEPWAFSLAAWGKDVCVRACLGASRAVVAVVYDQRSEALLRAMEDWIRAPSAERLQRVMGVEHAQYTPPARCLEEARKAILSQTMRSDPSTSLPPLSEDEARRLASALTERNGPGSARAEFRPCPPSTPTGPFEERWGVSVRQAWSGGDLHPMSLYDVHFELNLIRPPGQRVPLWRGDVERHAARAIRCAASRIYADEGLTPLTVRGAILEDCLPWVLRVRDPLETDLMERCTRP